MRAARTTFANIKCSSSVCKLPAAPWGEMRAGGARLRRRVIILVKAGAPVDSTIDGLVQFMEAGDIIIDGGNEWCAYAARPNSCHMPVFPSSLQQPHQELLKAELVFVAHARSCLMLSHGQVGQPGGLSYSRAPFHPVSPSRQFCIEKWAYALRVEACCVQV